jgi:hypothetical protein
MTPKNMAESQKRPHFQSPKISIEIGRHPKTSLHKSGSVYHPDPARAQESKIFGNGVFGKKLIRWWGTGPATRGGVIYLVDSSSSHMLVSKTGEISPVPH